MVLEQAIEWSVYTDWALLPHLGYFSGVPDLFRQLLDGEGGRAESADAPGPGPRL